MSLNISAFLKIFSGTIATRGISFCNTLLVARMVEIADFGRFTIFLFSMHLTRQIPSCFDIAFVNYAKQHSDPAEKQRYLGATLLLKGLFNLAVLATLWPLSWWIAVELLHSPDLHRPMAYGIGSGCALSFYFSFRAWHQERESFWIFGALQGVFPLGVLMILATLWITHGPVGLVPIMRTYTATAVLSGLIALVLLKWRMGATLASATAFARRILWLSKWVLGINIVWFLFQKIDIFYLSRLGDGHALGIYAAGAQLAMALTMITASLAGVFLPSAAAAGKSRSSMRDFLCGARPTLAGVELLFLAILICAPWIVSLSYGQEFREGATALRILTLGWMFHAAHLPFQFVYLALDRPALRLMLEAGRLSLVLVLLHTLTPANPISGTAWAMTLSTMAYTLASTVIVLRLIKGGAIPATTTCGERT